MPEKKTVEESFRDSLLDVKTIIERVGSRCSSIEELYEIVNLGCSNDGQLAFLMQIVTKEKK